jgi:hypothetical protein
LTEREISGAEMAPRVVGLPQPRGNSRQAPQPKASTGEVIVQVRQLHIDVRRLRRPSPSTHVSER